MKKYILPLLCLSVLLGCSPNAMYSPYASRNEHRMPSDPGSCYAKCLIQDTYEIETVEYYRYTGNDSDQEGVQKSTTIISEPSSKWEKKKADRNCLSANPEDCLVWCLVEVPAKTKEILEVVDTTMVKDFVVDTYLHRYLSQEGGFTEWKEIVCEKDVTPELYSFMQQALADRGYLEEGEVNGQIGAKSKAALVKFQKDNGFPIGALDFETLEALGVLD